LGLSNHEINNRARGEVLPQLSPERSSKEFFKGKALDIVTCFGQVEPLQLFYDPAERLF